MRYSYSVNSFWTFLSSVVFMFFTQTSCSLKKNSCPSSDPVNDITKLHRTAVELGNHLYLDSAYKYIYKKCPDFDYLSNQRSRYTIALMLSSLYRYQECTDLFSPIKETLLDSERVVFSFCQFCSFYKDGNKESIRILLKENALLLIRNFDSIRLRIDYKAQILAFCLYFLKGKDYLQEWIKLLNPNIFNVITASFIEEITFFEVIEDLVDVLLENCLREPIT